jgi:hypothetical protein
MELLCLGEDGLEVKMGPLSPAQIRRKSLFTAAKLMLLHFTEKSNIYIAKMPVFPLFHQTTSQSLPI